MHTTYQSPLASRYASPSMLHLFSSDFKYTTWRRLWIALAEAESEMGLPITSSQITSLKKNISPIDYKRVEELEHKLHHDVMAHIHAYGEAASEAQGIIHLGATSCYVTDNTDLIQMKEALFLITQKIFQLIEILAGFAAKYASLPCLSYTHLQVAQPTTVGKRACLWLQDLVLDYHNLTRISQEIRFLGLKGATGTQSSFLNLFEGDEHKVIELEKKVASKMGFSHLFLISGQTYTRKQDITILHGLGSLAASFHKFATDIRLLSHLGELHEPFGSHQVGSSAMPHKKNPIYSERICGIARFLISLQDNALYTEATQWLERSLDDSANRRLYIPESFLAADSLLTLTHHIVKNLSVSTKTIEQNLKKEIPFLLTEQILMHAVKKGKDRQKMHERLRTHTQEALEKLNTYGGDNSLLTLVAKDPLMGISQEELDRLSIPSALIGRATSQVDTFLKEEVAPLLKKLAYN